MKIDIQDFSKEQLIALVEDFAKRWLAHDGLWFQSVEKDHGMEEAIKHDINAWRAFTVLEAKRIMSFLKLEQGGGLEALAKALQLRLYAFINEQSIEIQGNKLIFKMTDCRVQSARERKQMDFFPCKPVGEVEYSKFAETIDPRIKTRCIGCPPDPKGEDFYCAWEFTLEE